MQVILSRHSTAEAIFTPGLLSEPNREFDHPLKIANLDIKAKFDSVNWEALKTLSFKGMPDILIWLINYRLMHKYKSPSPQW